MRTLILAFLGFLGLFSIQTSAVTVNRVNGSMNVVYVDFSVPGYAVPLELLRSYNSITALNETTGWSGAFGWGWTSPIETTLTVTPEKAVILRDGGTGNNVIFKASQSDPKVLSAFYKTVKKIYFEQKKGRKLSESELNQLELPDKMDSQLKNDSAFRAEIASRYKITTSPSSDVLVSSDYGYQTVQFKNGQWYREKDGITQIFDKDGRMVRQVDKNGFYFDYIYSGPNKLQLSEVHDQDRVTSLKFTWRKDRIVSVVDNRGKKSSYEFDGVGNLSQVTDSNQQSYAFKYENKKFPHLLTRIEYLSESSNKNKVARDFKFDDAGLLTYHRDKEGNETLYSYGRGTTNPETNFWTKTIYKAGSNSQETYEEFFLKARADGSKYLYKQDVKEPGSQSTTVFTACCGKPLQVSKNGEVTTFKYTDDGLLKEKIGPNEDIKIEYEPNWKKVSKVVQNGISSLYSYDSKGNLVKASNSKNEKVTLAYDKYGRIIEMMDSNKKRIQFKYGSQGKPVLISDKSIGSVKIAYDPEGRILKTETVLAGFQNRRPTQEQSQEVVRKIMKGFQNLLDIIRPAGVGLSSGSY